MTVAELIKLLQAMPQDARVAINDGEFGPLAHNRIEVVVGEAKEQRMVDRNLEDFMVPDCVIVG